jgi:glutamate 5-kinase
VPKGIPVVLLTAGHRQIRTGDALETQVKTADFEAGAAAVMKAHEAWIAKVPNGRQVIVPDAGHEIPREQPAFVIEAIKRTLNDMKEPNK